MDELYLRTFCSDCKAHTVHFSKEGGYECIHARFHADGEVEFYENLQEKIAEMMARATPEGQKVIDELVLWMSKYQNERRNNKKAG